MGGGGRRSSSLQGWGGRIVFPFQPGPAWISLAHPAGRPPHPTPSPLPPKCCCCHERGCCEWTQNMSMIEPKSWQQQHHGGLATWLPDTSFVGEQKPPPLQKNKDVWWVAGLPAMEGWEDSRGRENKLCFLAHPGVMWMLPNTERGGRTLGMREDFQLPSAFFKSFCTSDSQGWGRGHACSLCLGKREMVFLTSFPHAQNATTKHAAQWIKGKESKDCM